MPEEQAEALLKFKSFGRFEVIRQGKIIPAEEWPQRKAETLLKILLIERGRVFTQDQLIEALFPDLNADKAARNLHRRISELRHILEPHLQKGTESHYIVRAGIGGYCFSDKAPCWLDTEEFQKHCHIARKLANTDRWSQALDHYQQAISIYRGDYLAEDLYEEWSLGPREHWRELYLEALLHMAQCHARLKQFSQALECCQRVLEREPYRESAYRAKMLYHYYAGDPLEALKTFDACVQALKAQLDVEPAQETEELRDLIRQGKVPTLPKAIPNNLPIPPTPFIGRGEELEEICRMLTDPSCRLLTLVGPGGIGKTRLALQAASNMLDTFTDGVYFVPLASIRSPDRIVMVIADSLKFLFEGQKDPQQQLFDYVANQKVLLLLDSFEHLLDGATLLSQMLQSAGAVKLLVTSRERLKLQGEWTRQIHGLQVPKGETRDGVDRYSAVQLFVQNAQRACAQFKLTSEEVPSVVRICQLVEGMPLGIELAASWVHVLSCRQIATEIERNVSFLATSLKDVPERHRSMRAVFGHSWSLLSNDERETFMNLSVFRGGFGREAAEQIAGASLAVLAALVEKCLMGVDPSGRYEVHELLRQYGEDELEKAGQADLVRQRHLEFFLKLAEGADAELRGPDQVTWLDRLESERDNLRVALEYSLKNHLETGLRLAVALRSLWEVRGYLTEGRQWLNQFLALPAASSVSPPVRARALLEAGYLAYRQDQLQQAKSLCAQSLRLFEELEDKKSAARTLVILGNISTDAGEYRPAVASYEESLALSREIADTRSIALTLGNLGYLATCQAEDDRAVALLEESLKLCQELGEKRGMSWSLLQLARVKWHQGHYDQAQTLCEASRAISQELGDKARIAYTLESLGLIAYAQGDYQQAIASLEESLRLCEEVKDNWLIAQCFEVLAAIACAQERFERAAALLGAAEVLREATHTPRHAAEKTHYERAVASVRAKLGKPGTTAAWAKGRAMAREQAIAYALERAGQDLCTQ